MHERIEHPFIFVSFSQFLFQGKVQGTKKETIHNPKAKLKIALVAAGDDDLVDLGRKGVNFMYLWNIMLIWLAVFLGLF